MLPPDPYGAFAGNRIIPWATIPRRFVTTSTISILHRSSGSWWVVGERFARSSTCGGRRGCRLGLYGATRAAAGGGLMIPARKLRFVLAVDDYEAGESFDKRVRIAVQFGQLGDARGR
jgi:hypothetical protein